MDKKQSLADMGKRLASRRKFLGLSQEDAAEKADVLQQSISDAENGKTALGSDNLMKICRAYDVSADFILFGTVNDTDLQALDSRIKLLPAEKYQHLEGIIKHYLDALLAD